MNHDKTQLIFDHLQRLIRDKLKDPKLDNSKEMDVVHKQINDIILDELGMKNTFGYYKDEIRKDIYGE